MKKKTKKKVKANVNAQPLTWAETIRKMSKKELVAEVERLIGRLKEVDDERKHFHDIMFHQNKFIQSVNYAADNFLKGNPLTRLSVNRADTCQNKF